MWPHANILHVHKYIAHMQVVCTWPPDGVRGTERKQGTPLFVATWLDSHSLSPFNRKNSSAKRVSMLHVRLCLRVHLCWFQFGVTMVISIVILLVQEPEQ